MNTKFTIIVIIFIGIVAFAIGDSEYYYTKKGLEKYEMDDFSTARKFFKRAKEKNEHNIIHNLNIGATLYRENKFEEAILEYRKAITKNANISDTALASDLIYNIGNANYMLDSLKQAKVNYQMSLKLDPSDMNAKYNLELVTKKMMQNQQQSKNEQNQEQKQNKQQQDKKQKKDEQQQKQQDKQEQQQKQQKDSDKQQEQQRQQQKQEQQQKRQETGMTKQQALRIMEAMERPEQEELSNWLKEQRRQKGRGKKFENPRDW